MPRDDWVFEIRYHKSERLDNEILIIPGYIEVIGTLSGSVKIKLGSNPSYYETKSYMQLDQWTHLTLMSEVSGTTT